MNAKEYLSRITPAAQRSSLSPFHADILELRAAGCTLAQITEFLRLNNLAVTFSTVGRYLRKYASPPPASDALGASPPCPADAHGSVLPSGVPSVSVALPSPVDGIKSIEQLRAEHPTTPPMQLSKLYAQQYDRPALTAEIIDDLKRRFPHHTKA